MFFENYGYSGLSFVEWLLIAGAVCFALECVTGSFILLGVGCGLFINAALITLIPGLDIKIQVAILCASSVALILGFRAIFRHLHDEAQAKKDINTY